MRVDERQHARLHHFAQHIAAQVAQLGFVDHLEPAIDEWLDLAFWLDRHFAVHQQTVFGQLGHELAGLHA